MVARKKNTSTPKALRPIENYNETLYGPQLEVGRLVFALYTDSHWPAVVRQDKGSTVSIVFLPFKVKDQPFSKKKSILINIDSLEDLKVPSDCTNPEYRVAFEIARYLFKLGPSKSIGILTQPLTLRQYGAAMKGERISYAYLGTAPLDSPSTPEALHENEKDSGGGAQACLVQKLRTSLKLGVFKKPSEQSTKRKVNTMDDAPAKKISRQIGLNEKLFAPNTRKLTSEELKNVDTNTVYLASIENPLNMGLWPLLVNDVTLETYKAFGLPPSEEKIKLENLHYFPINQLDAFINASKVEECDSLDKALTEVHSYLVAKKQYDAKRQAPLTVNELDADTMNMDALSIGERGARRVKKIDRKEQLMQSKADAVLQQMYMENNQENIENQSGNYLPDVHIDDAELLFPAYEPLLPNLYLSEKDLIGTAVGDHFEGVWNGKVPNNYLIRHHQFMNSLQSQRILHFSRFVGVCANSFGLIDSHTMEKVYTEYTGLIRLNNKLPRLTEMEIVKYIMLVMIPNAIEFVVEDKYHMDSRTVKIFLSLCDQITEAREHRENCVELVRKLEALMQKHCPSFFTEVPEAELPSTSSIDVTSLD